MLYHNVLKTSISMKRLIKKPLFTVWAIVIVLAAVWCASLIKCEILTKKYYNEFEYAYADNAMLGDMEYFKVLDCDGKTAKVYYVSKDMTAANVLSFEKQQGEWIQTQWKTIWSESGSASDVVYPYWWHFVYGGF